jgi:hypothetical protein
MAIVITRPVSSSGGGSPQLSTVITNTIAPISTEMVDSIPMIDVIGIKWFIVIKNNITNESMIQEVYAVLKTPNSISHTIYGITGVLQPHLIEVDINPLLSTIELKITNNSTSSEYTIKIVRIMI